MIYFTFALYSDMFASISHILDIFVSATKCVLLGWKRVQLQGLLCCFASLVL